MLNEIDDGLRKIALRAERKRKKRLRAERRLELVIKPLAARKHA
jgi:hypothetical protein